MPRRQLAPLLFVVVSHAVCGFASAQQKMYWTDLGAHKIQRANLDGTEVEDVIPGGLGAPDDIALDAGGGRMYWTDFHSGAIRRATLDGEDVEVLVDATQEGAFGIDLDLGGGRMYWATGPGIIVANLDGSHAAMLRRVRAEGVTIDSQAERIYWTESDGFTYALIARAFLDGSGRELVVDLPGMFRFPIDVAVDDGAGIVFWTDAGSGTVERANLDGSNLQVLASHSDGLDSPWGIAVDPTTQTLYWTDAGTATIQCVSYDGSDVTTLISLGSASLGGIALDLRQPVEALVLDIKPGSCPNRVNKKSAGLVPMAVVGTDTFDVQSIEPDSLHLSRSDAVGGTVRPVRHGRGKSRGREQSSVEIDDVATPFDGKECDCHNARGDGIDDLVVMFSTREMVEAFALGSIGRGELVGLTVSGVTSDGTTFAASDCITIVGRQ